MRIWILCFFLFGTTSNFYSSDAAMEQPTLKIFDPPEEVSVKKLKGQGFVFDEDVDVTLLVKQINDSTRVEFFVADSNKKVISKTWKIKCERKLSIDEVEKFVRANGGLIVTTLCNELPEYRLDFFVESRGGFYFRCTYSYHPDYDDIIEISYRYPEYYNLKEFN